MSNRSPPGHKFSSRPSLISSRLKKASHSFEPQICSLQLFRGRIFKCPVLPTLDVGILQVLETLQCVAFAAIFTINWPSVGYSWMNRPHKPFFSQLGGNRLKEIISLTSEPTHHQWPRLHSSIWLLGQSTGVIHLKSQRVNLLDYNGIWTNCYYGSTKTPHEEQEQEQEHVQRVKNN